MVGILAIVCARNEAVHIERCIRDLIAGGCEVCLIDNDSTDGTTDLAIPFLGHGLVSIKNLPWRGAFSLSEQLDAKRAVVQAESHDWIVHVDADEWLVSPVKGETLAEAIAAADASGFNVVNFHECVFIPRPDMDFNQPDYATKMCDYYFFQPSYPRLNRAWRRDAELDNSQSGGHALSGMNINRFPRDLILRHYIALSQDQAINKYVNRVFAQEDLDRRWHGNRLLINSDNIRLNTHASMRRLDNPLDHDQFDLSRPIGLHFWQWPAT